MPLAAQRQNTAAHIAGSSAKRKLKISEVCTVRAEKIGTGLKLFLFRCNFSVFNKMYIKAEHAVQEVHKSKNERKPNKTADTGKNTKGISKTKRYFIASKKYLRCHNFCIPNKAYKHIHTKDAVWYSGTAAA